ncbi:RagB/SusD family nutrient uptake outer membrane protein [Sphingobacterium sp.]|uniref:RagB/SusD family nutrient uptake outer membrane protein n=1 Tax=Sphingobacterium sp. TaxID=341027 RepID=UPI002586D416|nr:RagB/SusD family nutrient uptake outer membrane protein [Sphingobacterium sp.]WET68775.1 MAG: RagB/SusD family nutrient uptake outer membrane protein [Sphingobacterium sp.]
MKKQFIYTVLILIVLSACSKDFLDIKPSSSIVQPSTLEDMEGLLENHGVMNSISPALGQLSSDEYFFVDQKAWQGTLTQTERLAYVWEKDIYNGDINIMDWNKPYAAIFYANNIISQMDKISPAIDTRRYNNLLGWAYFARSYAYYELLRNFCKYYDANTANVELGLPLKLSPNVDEVVQRSSLAETYNFIMSDLNKATQLLDANDYISKRNHASKAACYALSARIMHATGNYAKALLYADSTLLLHNNLVDYNTVSLSSQTPFTYVMDEVIYFSTQVNNYAGTTGYLNRTAVGVDTQLYGMYKPNDLRKEIYFMKNSLGNYNVKRGYLGGGSYPFTGLATDEIYLIKAECLVRSGNTTSAIDVMNDLLIKRYTKGKYNLIEPMDSKSMLTLILDERRKELVWRGLRWMDLKRLNKEGGGIELQRQVSAQNYTLPANSKRYTFPIPDDEIAFSHIMQNER